MTETYKFYVPEEHEALLEAELREVSERIKKTLAAQAQAGMSFTWNFLWFGEEANGVKVGVLHVDFVWPVAKALRAKIPGHEDWVKAFKKELTKYAGLKIYHLQGGLTEKQVFP